MSGPHPLNQAVIAQALHDLRNGQLRRARSMGFDAQDLDALKNPAMVAILANAAICWCSVTINRDVLRRLLSQIHSFAKEIEEVDRLLRLGASTELITRFFGLTHQEIALRRDILGLPKRKGRHPVLTEEQDANLWELWSAAIKERKIALTDETTMFALAADLAESTDLPLSVVWSAIRGWIDEGQI
ncbi:DUF2857 domain-containing protein [Acidomonas methanolica]|uniref:Coproporphyrinogen III oxidase n=1 Tax=Acidomonas methanolica NBRC 104435 TaxID=1231351 RepID=A0A023D6I5_ACIMT|nr:DUF2857 domain-containing protein [Acidomonas methanolica]MBU2655104.1 DUF2857 domain-containing protein [Acidomonas methanolica]TCS29512.1 uncharacterized protein DUF2857 [Acidomonas methanolica]GAJ29355.1 hypothetical protein Amme_059_074 [Acidomonas methanolica NBRC 104435]GBQ48355.1 hypothetical protein AA0498_0737 [Acidomonas methanolica]GEK99118.1 hypothetical protein AME01nite_16170 [Acidomonas methanolica NBRC 104435]